MLRQYIWLICTLLPVLAWGSDRPVLLRNLAFHSPAEQQAYWSMTGEGQGNLLEMLVRGSGKSGAETDLAASRDFMEKVYQTVEKESQWDGSEEEVIGSISRVLQGHFLGDYQKVVGFQELVASGKFNCVSATGLYALVFDHFKIPFEIKEQADHVYLVAGLRSRMVVESTSERGEVLRPTRRMQREWLRYLRQNGMVNRRDMKEQGRTTVFQSHFFADRSITAAELCGIQYLNAGIAYLQSNQPGPALDALEKAEGLYPRPEVRRMRVLAAHQQLERLPKGSQEAYLGNLRLLAAAAGTDWQGQAEALALNGIREYLLFQHGVQVEVELETWMELHRSSTDFRRDLRHFVHLLRAEDAHDLGHIPQAWDHIQQAYTYDPNDPVTRDLMCRVGLARHAGITEPRELYGRLKTLVMTYPDLKDELVLRDALAQTHWLLAEAAFDANQGELAQEHLDLAKAQNVPHWEGNSEKIGRVYSAQVRFHFRTGDYNAAQKALQTGLSLAPLDPSLQRTHRIFAGEIAN